MKLLSKEFEDYSVEVHFDNNDDDDDDDLGKEVVFIIKLNYMGNIFFSIQNDIENVDIYSFGVFTDKKDIWDKFYEIANEYGNFERNELNLATYQVPCIIFDKVNLENLIDEFLEVE